MILDTFCFMNEFDILDIRLEYLDSVVDKFVLVESSTTQTGIPKPYYFKENKQRFEKYLHKIVDIQVDDGPVEGGWAREHFQRNATARGYKHCFADDIVLLSDVDEIPDKGAIYKYLDFHSYDICVFDQVFCAYYLNLASPNKGWKGTTIGRVGQFSNYTPQHMRNVKDRLPVLGKGWHFSWCGGWEAVKTKFINCVEPFSKNLDFVALEAHYNKLAQDGGFFLHSDNPDNLSVPLQKLPIDVLPDVIKNNVEKYKKLLI